MPSVLTESDTSQAKKRLGSTALPGRWQRLWARLGQSELMLVASTATIGTLVALAFSFVFQPIPQIQDEFAYLLSADTFASGEITNPTHPHWPHFESMQIFHQPSYNAKYPPGQSLVLAAGQLLGNPISGACLATGISMAALMWMLLGWLPKSKESNHFGLFCMVMIVSHPGLQLIWGQSYMGGALAMTGGALLLGALPRCNDGLKFSLSTAAAVGIALLAVTRPFEGAILSGSVFIALAWQLWQGVRQSRFSLSQIATNVIAPVAIIAAISGAFFLTYNDRVTGNALTMPYSLHESTYGWNNVFLWQTAGEAPDYRHEAMFRFFEDDVMTTREKFSELGTATYSQLDTLAKNMLFFLGCSLIIGLAGVPWFLRHPNSKLALAILLPGLATVLVTPWGHPHYIAPFAPLILLFAMGGLLELWQAKNRFAIVRRWNWRLVVTLQLAWLVIIGWKSFSAEHVGWHRQRAAVEQRLLEMPKKDLVFVHYQPSHDVHAEWVYNKSDIDDSEIVWAREISPEQDAALCQYFSDRKVWHVNADDRVVEPIPHESVLKLSQTKVSQ